MATGTSFRPIIADVDADPGRTCVVALCSGKIAYDLDRVRREANILDALAIIRIEQIYPFPMSELQQEIARFANAKIVWCQEEPQNQGAWPFVQNKLASHEFFRRRCQYVGRSELAACAGGSVERHEREHKEILARLIDLCRS